MVSLDRCFTMRQHIFLKKKDIMKQLYLILVIVTHICFTATAMSNKLVPIEEQTGTQKKYSKLLLKETKTYKLSKKKHLDELLTQGANLYTASKKYRLSLLVHASTSGNVTMVTWLLNKALFDQSNKNEALYCAVLGSAAEETLYNGIAKALIQAGADVNAHNGLTFRTVIAEGNKKLFDIFVSQPTLDINCKDSEDQTPLDYTVKYGQLTMFNILLRIKGSIGQREKDTLLYNAAFYNQKYMVKKLLSLGASIYSDYFSGAEGNAWKVAIARNYNDIVHIFSMIHQRNIANNKIGKQPLRDEKKKSSSETELKKTFFSPQPVGIMTLGNIIK